MPTHLAVAIAATDTEAALEQAQQASAFATLVEYRLDLMDDFDLHKLIHNSPLPAIITCRWSEEGGRFPGSEQERRDILRQALVLGAAFVDIEAEALAELAPLAGPQMRIIGSHHDFQGMMGDWAATEIKLRARGAHIVKLVGMAATTDDALPPLAWLHRLKGPGVGIAMGEAGAATRLLAARFPRAFLTFAATETRGTAAGQISANEMVERFGFRHLARAEPCFVLLAPPPLPWPFIEDLRSALKQAFPSPAHAWLLPIPADSLTPGLLLALELAHVRGLIALPEVVRDPALREYGLDPDHQVWILGSSPHPSLAKADDPDEIIHFFATGGR
ncbi:MAG: type I 3-dehydroquinate dehydratase [Chloroflexi bacterium]|nr:type I 3-dehydroquinate dehydratase [Chloroflexota bacterium]